MQKRKTGIFIPPGSLNRQVAIEAVEVGVIVIKKIGIVRGIFDVKA